MSDVAAAGDWVAPPSHRAAQVAAWVAVAALVAALHIAGGYWLARAAIPAEVPGTPEDVVIEISLEPMAAPESVPDNVPDIPMQEAPDLPIAAEDTPEVDQLRTDEAPVPETQTPDLQAVPLPDQLPTAEAPPEPPPEVPPVVETAEATLAPMAAPRPPARPERQTAQRPPAPDTVAPPKVDGARAREAAAPAAARGKVSKQVEQDWARAVNNRVARHMARWPNRLRRQISFHIDIFVDGAGRVTGIKLRGSTGDAAADAALRAHASRMPSLPAPPDGQGRTLRVPITLAPR